MLIFLARILQYCLAAVDVSPFRSHQAFYVDHQLSFHWIRRGCRVANANLSLVSVSSARDASRPWSKSTATYSSSLACFSNLQWDEFRDLISVPLFTVIILPFTPITEKGRGSNAGVRTSALVCFKRTWSLTTIRFSRAFRLLSGYSFICFFFFTSLIGS